MSVQPAFFETQAIRRVYDEETETWWFSVVDIMQVLTQQPDYQAARNYWKVLKNRLVKEGSQSVTNCNRLIFTALAEVSTRQIAETDEATGLAENTDAATKGGAIAKQARKALEAKTGKSVVTGDNFLPPGKVPPRKVTKKS